MKLIQLKCPGCGAKLEVNPSLDKYTCNYCGVTTVIDDETIKVKNISSRLDSYINELKEYYENGNYERCYMLSLQYLNEYPQNRDIADYMWKSRFEYGKMYAIQVLSSNYVINSSFINIDTNRIYADRNTQRFVDDYRYTKELHNDFPNEQTIIDAYNYLNSILNKHKKHQEVVWIILGIGIIVLAIVILIVG